MGTDNGGFEFGNLTVRRVDFVEKHQDFIFQSRYLMPGMGNFAFKCFEVVASAGGIALVTQLLDLTGMRFDRRFLGPVRDLQMLDVVGRFSPCFFGTFVARLKAGQLTGQRRQCGSQIAFTAAEMMDSSEKLACGYLGHGTLPGWAGGNTARTSKLLL
jgi:hypothetical protein